MAACVSGSLLVAGLHHGQSGQPDTNDAAGPPQAGRMERKLPNDRVINNINHVTTR